ncbi:MAG: hypothetical protein AAF213_13475 [Pseudomonadota bacterium]
MNPALTALTLTMLSNTGGIGGSSGSFSRHRGGRGGGNNADSRKERQKTAWVSLPSYDGLASFAAGEQVADPLPPLPEFDGQKATSLQEVVDRAQAFGEFEGTSAADRQKAIDAIQAIAEWAIPFGDDKKLQIRISDSAKDAKFLEDQKRRRDNALIYAESSERSVTHHMSYAYADPKEAERLFDEMKAADAPGAYRAVIANPGILGTLKGTGVGVGGLAGGRLRNTFLNKLGNAQYRDAVSDQNRMIREMREVITEHVKHEDLSAAYDENVAKRQTAPHLSDFGDAAKRFKTFVSGEEFRRLRTDVDAHHAYEAALKIDPAAAFLQAHTIAQGADPGGRWEQLMENAGTALAKKAAELGYDVPTLEPDEPSPASKAAPGAR